MHGFYVAVRGEADDDPNPQLFFTKRFADFLRDVIGMTPQLVALRAESYIVTGLSK